MQEVTAGTPENLGVTPHVAHVSQKAEGVLGRTQCGAAHAPEGTRTGAHGKGKVGLRREESGM